MKNLRATTVFTFQDGDNGFSVAYPGLWDFQDGDVINLIRASEKMPIRSGDYRVVRNKHIFNQLSLKDEEPDTLIRFYTCFRN